MESGVPSDRGGSLIRHAAPGAIGALMVPVIEAPFRTALMAGVGGLHRAAARQHTAACRAVGVATVAAAPLALVLRGNTESVVTWLHPLKEKALRRSRYGSKRASDGPVDESLGIVPCQFSLNSHVGIEMALSISVPALPPPPQFADQMLIA